MTDHKFTDEEEEVINVLCFYVDRQCNNCDIDDSACCVCCINTTIRDALTLINRQKAEIERLNSEVKEKTETIAFLKDQAVGWSIDFCNLKAKLNTAKSEAIKEFAERLKANMSNIARMEYGGNIYFCVGYDLIDSLVKEMTEGKANECEEVGKSGF